MIKKMLYISKNKVVLYYWNHDTQDLICNDGKAVEKAINLKKRLTQIEKYGKVLVKVG